MRLPFLFLPLSGLAISILSGQEAPGPSPSSEDKQPSNRPLHEGMVLIPGGTYTRGSQHKFAETRTEYPEERPVHEVTVDGF